MAKDIEPKLKLISEYLKLDKEEKFVIPEYQRGYSWDITQCDKLWQDIDTFIASGASDPYFFGTIIVDCSETSEFSLIDGQQRTTTFLLLLKSLLMQLNKTIPEISNDEDSEALEAGLVANRNKIMKILYKVEDEDIPSMIKNHTKTKIKLILENKSINELYRDEVKIIIESIDFETSKNNVSKIPRKQMDNKYTNHFRNFKYFYNKLGEKSETQLNQFAKMFLEKCQIIEIRSWQIEQAITMFNSLNSTGMPLSDADIISAQLYSNAGENKDLFNEQWENINKLANELSSKKIIDIDGVLRQLMYIKRASDREYISINKEEGKEYVDVTTPGLRRYYTEINKELLNDPLELCEKLSKITKIWDKIKDYPIVKLLLKCNENVRLFLSSYLYRFEAESITEEEIFDLSETLLRLFTLLELSDTGYSNSKFKTFLFGENIRLVDKTIPIDTIKNNFNEHINKNWKFEDILDRITEYDGKKNFLVFLNEYIYAKNKRIGFDFSENVNVEHIMPDSGRNITTIQKDANIEKPEDFESLVNKLGNKILLEEKINKSLSNEWFRTKKQSSINRKKGYKDSSFGIASSLTNYPKDTWAKEDIEKATQKAAERIVNFIFDK